MARYRKVDPRIWNDSKFRKLSDDAKFLFLFVVTHPHSTSLGAFRSTVAGLSAELQWTLKRGRKAFNQLLECGLVESDESVGFVGLPNFLKYNLPESPNVIKSWRDGYDLIPECDLKGRLTHRMKLLAAKMGEGFMKAFWEGFGKDFPEGVSELARVDNENPSANPEPEPEQEQKHRTRRRRGSGFLKNVTKEMLGNTTTLLKWLSTSTDPDLPGDDYETQLRIIGLAVRVTTADGIEDPIKVFVALVRDRDWSKISDDQRTEAKARYRTWQESIRSPPHASVFSSPPTERIADNKAVQVARLKERQHRDVSAPP